MCVMNRPVFVHTKGFYSLINFPLLFLFSFVIAAISFSTMLGWKFWGKGGKLGLHGSP